jgi:2-methylcitrate dehydratase PrpD
MVKRMHAGRAAQSGLYGALLAENGFTGIVNVLESEYGGFCTTFSRSTDRFRLAELTAGLGEKWETMGIALKFYSCVGSNHTTLDAIRTIQARRPFKNEEIAKIVVHGSQATAEHVGWPYKPQGVTSAQMNLPFCVGTLLTEGDVFVDQFNDSVVTDPRRMALADKVTVLHDPAITALGARLRHKVRVEVHFTDGSRQDETVEAPRGSENKFASEADVVEKFTKLTRDVIGAPNSAKIAEMVLGLDKLGDVAGLVKALAK